MSVIEIGKLRFGDGKPKICVPLTGESMPALLNEAHQVRSLPADLFEWRADCFYGSFNEALCGLRSEISAPLLCTVRTEHEGGKAELTPDKYECVVMQLLEIGGFDMIDIELSCGDERVKRLVKMARERQICVVISRHNFAETPPESEIFSSLCRMKELGADLPKMAVMPRTPGDVLAVLSATLRANEEIGPVITMAMGELGKITRVAGEIFGSCMTFGAGQSASAPGQINAEDLRAIIEDVSPV